LGLFPRAQRLVCKGMGNDGTVLVPCVLVGVQEIDSRDNLVWDKILEENNMIIVSYYNYVDCDVCVDLYKVFVELSTQEKYKDVIFVAVDTAQNEIADQYIRRKKQPFLANYKDGFLIECNSVGNTEEMLKMLDSLFTYQLKI
jgi:hypothetical protein